MKHLARLLTVFSLLIGFCGWFSTPQIAQAANFQSLTLPSVSILAVEGGKTKLRNQADDKLATEFGNKIDLNNTGVRGFLKYQGLYPTLAQKIVTNAPYKKVEDVLDIPGLTPRQLDRLKKNLDNFTVTETTPLFNEGDDRINPGIYN